MELEKKTFFNIIKININNIIVGSIIYFIILKNSFVELYEISSFSSFRDIVWTFVCIIISVLPMSFIINTETAREINKGLNKGNDLITKPKQVISYLLDSISVEFLFRVSMLSLLISTYSENTSILISSVLFTVYHAWYSKNLSFLLYVFWTGCIFGYVYINTSSFLVVIIAHLFNSIILKVINSGSIHQFFTEYK